MCTLSYVCPVSRFTNFKFNHSQSFFQSLIDFLLLGILLYGLSSPTSRWTRIRSWFASLSRSILIRYVAPILRFTNSFLSYVRFNNIIKILSQFHHDINFNNSVTLSSNINNLCASNKSRHLDGNLIMFY